MAQFNAAQQRTRDTMRMLASIKDNRLRQKRVKELPPIQIRMAELSPSAYCALMQMKGAMPSATPAQLEEAQRVFGGVLDQTTRRAAVIKGLRELDEMGIVVFVPPDDVFCYPNIDLLTEVTDASKLVS